MPHKESPPVFVTRAMLPPLETYVEKLRGIFSSRYLTNQGVHAEALERELQDYLAVRELVLCTNGTLALQLALRLLGLNGKKVITTPFTYVATLSALLWEGCTPLFADIDPHSLCMSPSEAERLLESHPDAAGVLPVHVYGNACDVQALERICRTHHVKLLYDAAHAFGTTLHGRSLFHWGDAATGSLHATKVFNSVEGGCIVVASDEAREHLKLLRSFGHCDDTHICLGINAKMSELHAAMGRCLLPMVPDFLKCRERLTALYDAHLAPVLGQALRKPRLAEGLCWNHAYYPVFFPDHAALLRCLRALTKKNIRPRRYFYPSLNTLPYVQASACPVSEDMAQRVACLPLWPDMDEKIVLQTSKIVIDSM